MGKLIDAGKEAKAMTYEALSQRIFAIAETKSHFMGDSISEESGTYWLIGQTLVWHADESLERLALDLRKQCGKSWNARDLARMFELYLHYPTLERLSARCAGRGSVMSLDELLNHVR